MLQHRVRALAAALATGLALTATPAAAQAADRSAGNALLVESAGGILGSGAGLGLGLLLADAGGCVSDDISCYIENAAIAAAISTIGSGLGTNLAGRIGSTRPSAVAGWIGAIAGAAAGIGVTHLLAEELDLTRSDLVLAFSYSITQGVVSAVGSRIGAWLRD
ncbi:MAG: hypothetical protein L0271_16960 [Gemmatimonadetes bacterium]|nr:hypothetical protein [Gemmatimonadota bacterium]